MMVLGFISDKGTKEVAFCVSILLVMDDGLGDRVWSRGGITAAVSILLVMDDGLGEKSTRH